MCISLKKIDFTIMLNKAIRFTDPFCLKSKLDTGNKLQAEWAWRLVFPVAPTCAIYDWFLCCMNVRWNKITKATSPASPSPMGRERVQSKSDDCQLFLTLSSTTLFYFFTSCFILLHDNNPINMKLILPILFRFSVLLLPK